MTTSLKIENLTLDLDYQKRLMGVLPDVVDEYSDAMKDGAKFPPVTVFLTGDGYLLVDGFHRVEAAKAIGETSINTVLKTGTTQEAYDYARFTANRTNGMRLNRSDLQAIVLELITDPKYAKKPSTQLAEIANVSHTTIQRARKALDLTPTTIVTKDGVERAVAPKTVDAAGFVPLAGQSEKEKAKAEELIGDLLHDLTNLSITVERVRAKGIELTHEVKSQIEQKVNRLSELLN